MFSSETILDLPASLASRMYKHQKEGVQWLSDLHKNSEYSGGILGDDMGLGKTFMITSFLTSLIRNQEVQNVLIICPVSVLQSWSRELNEHMVPNKGSANLRIEVIEAEMGMNRRKKVLSELFSDMSPSRPHVIVSSYQLVSNMINVFANEDSANGTGEGNSKRWDWVILDEGHIIKNPNTKLSKSMNYLPSCHRMILTGTPVQNNLQEFWSLINWCTHGNLLGSRKEFKKKYMEPIVNGRNPHASLIEQRRSERATNELANLIRPILLQRKKESVIQSGKQLSSDFTKENENSNGYAKMDVEKNHMSLPSKKEIAIWVPLSDTQRNLYEKFLQSRAVSSVLNSRAAYPVELINHLKTLCRHPFLLESGEMSKRRAQVDKISVLEKAFKNMNFRTTLSQNANVFEVASRTPSCTELLKGSNKLEVLVSLVKHLRKDKHRILIFSQSKLQIDLIEKVVEESGFATVRIDGGVKGKQRQVIIDSFNMPVVEEEHSQKKNNLRAHVCLLSTKACCTGITLTGADRVILHDPSWNPASDRQAVDRAYRIGQKKDVLVYRLLSSGTVEEKIYEKQVFKDGVRVLLEMGIREQENECENEEIISNSKSSTPKHRQQERYFSSEETKALFTLAPHHQCSVLDRISSVWKEEKHNQLSHTGINLSNNQSNKSSRSAVRGNIWAPCDLPHVLGYSRHDGLYDESPRTPTIIEGDTQNDPNRKTKNVAVELDLTISPPPRRIDFSKSNSDWNMSGIMYAPTFSTKLGNGVNGDEVIYSEESDYDEDIGDYEYCDDDDDDDDNDDRGKSDLGVESDDEVLFFDKSREHKRGCISTNLHQDSSLLNEFISTENGLESDSDNDLVNHPVFTEIRVSGQCEDLDSDSENDDVIFFDFTKEDENEVNDKIEKEGKDGIRKRIILDSESEDEDIEIKNRNSHHDIICTTPETVTSDCQICRNSQPRQLTINPAGYPSYFKFVEVDDAFACFCMKETIYPCYRGLSTLSCTDYMNQYNHYIDSASSETNCEAKCAFLCAALIICDEDTFLLRKIHLLQIEVEEQFLL